MREEPISRSCRPDRLGEPPDTILRFALTERLLHWAIAIPFLGCLVSAAVLVVVYNPDPTRAYRELFAWMHRACGAGLILCPGLVLLASVRRLRIYLYNIRQAWVWTFDDITWLALVGPAALSRRIILPDQGKFNAAEKLNFMMVTVFPPFFIATGVLIWFPDSTQLGAFFPWLVHCGLAALALPLACGHMFMATINPSTRVGLTGMVSGFVSREWAAHHYARWFREQFPDLAQEFGGQSPRDAGMTAGASAGTEMGPQPATVDPLPFEHLHRSPLLAAHAPLGEPVVQPPTLSTIPFAHSRASLTSLQTRAQPTVDPSATAEMPRSGVTRVAEREADRVRWTRLLADDMAGAHEIGLAANETDDVVLQAPGEIGDAFDVKCEADSPDAVPAAG